MNQNRRKNRGGPQAARSTRQRAVAAEGVYNNPHFMYAATSQVGNIVRIQVASGTVWEGVFRTFSAQFDIVLEMACKVDNPDSHNSSLAAESHVDKLIFKPCDIVAMSARDVDLDYATRDTFQTDAAISQRLNGAQGREEKELEPWEGPCANGQLDGGGLDALEAGSNGWDANEMFRKNEQKYGVQSTYDHSLSGYTVALQHSDSQDYREAEAKANEIAAEIESQPSYKSRLDLENGDEEERFAAVARPGGGGGGGGNGGGGGRMGGGGHHHQQHSHDYKDSSSSDKYVPPNKRKGSQSTGKIMRSTPPPSASQSQSQAHQAPPAAQQSAPHQNQPNLNQPNHPKGGSNIPIQQQTHVMHLPPAQQAPPQQPPPQQAPPPQQPAQTHAQNPPPPQQQQQQQQQPPPPQQQQQAQPPPPQHMNHARHTPPHAGHAPHVYTQSMPARGNKMNGDGNMGMGPGGPGGGMKGMQRPPRNIYGGMNQQYEKMPPQHVQHAQQQEIIRQQQQGRQGPQAQGPPGQQAPHSEDIKDLIKFSKDFKLAGGPEMAQQQMVGMPPQVPQQQQQQEVKLPMPQPTPPPPQQSVSPRLQPHQQQQQEHQEEKAKVKSTLNPLAKEFVMKPFAARSPSTPTASRPHTPQTPSNNQYIATTVNGPPPGQQPMPVMMHMPPALYVSQQQFQQPVQGNRVRKAVMGQVRTDMASQMQVAAATGQPLLAPAPMQQFVYQQGINPQAYQQMHMRMDGYPPMYIQQPNPSQAPSPAQQQPYAQAGAPGAPGPGQQYQAGVPPPPGPPQMYLPMQLGQPHLMQPGMYHLQQQAPQMPVLIANPPPPHQHGPNP